MRWRLNETDEETIGDFETSGSLVIAREPKATAAIQDNAWHEFHTVYILTNATHRVLYTGVTRNLARRIGEH